MEVLKFVVQYWLQFAFVFAAIGYILKVIFDFRYKKKEIYYHLFAAEQLKKIIDFFALYVKMQEAMDDCLDCVDTSKEPKEHEESLREFINISKEFSEVGNKLYFFTNKNDEAIIQKITSSYQSVIGRLEKYFNTDYYVDKNKDALIKLTRHVKGEFLETDFYMNKIKRKYHP